MPSKCRIISALPGGMLVAGLPFYPYQGEMATAHSYPVILLGEPQMSLRKLSSLLLMAATTSVCWAAGGTPSVRAGAAQTTLAGRERQLWVAAVHDSKFSPMSAAAVRAACEAVQFPVALATPDPLIDEPRASSRVSVTFIVGTDGRVHSPFMLESRGPSEDRIVLDAVRAWRIDRPPATASQLKSKRKSRFQVASEIVID